MGKRRSRGFDLKPLKDYTLDEIIKVGAVGPYFRYGADGSEYKKSIAALKKCGMDEDVADARLSQIWVEVQDIDVYNRPTEIFKRAIGGDPVLDSMKDLESVTDAIFSYMNNIPRWCLGGRTPKEVPIPKEHREQLASFTAAMDRVTDMMKNTPRVGRNGPCPCGSGLKYKNCHGKNFS